LSAGWRTVVHPQPSQPGKGFCKTAAFFMYIVYVLYSIAYDKIYIGFTSNLESRFKSHNELGTKGWTIRFRPWSILHTENFDSKASAMKREQQLKSAMGRAFIKEMVQKKYSTQ
jgi:putative endonuclease